MKTLKKIISGIFKAWMNFARALGRVNTVILLSVVYYLMFTPLGLLARLFGRDPLERKWTKEATYWKKRDIKPFRPEDYLRQF